jgi:predicted nucleic acid-binding protein
VKLLVDTSVWSLALRRRDPENLGKDERKLTAQLAQAIDDGLVAMIGPIRQELLSGIKEAAQFEKLRQALEPFRDEAVETADYEYAARLYNACRSRGVEAGTVDMLICAVALRRRWRVLSTDLGLFRCLEVGTAMEKADDKTPPGEAQKGRRPVRGASAKPWQKK